MIPLSGDAPMNSREMVSSRYPEAQAAVEPLIFQRTIQTQRGCWFIYAGPDLDARVLGRGITEAKAWADAARRLRNAKFRDRLVVWV
jgi:hypothetical protein